MIDSDRETRTRADAPFATRPRTGWPIDLRRVLVVLRRNLPWIFGMTVIAALGGVLLARFVITRTYSSSASLLWEPPAASRTDGSRELSTLVNSVKLPTNLVQVRERTGYQGPLIDLASDLEVSAADNSMLITITGKAPSPKAAADLTNTTVDVFLDAQKKVSETRLRETALALKQSLDQSHKALTEARARYDEFRSANKIDDLAAETQSAIEELARLRVVENNARVELESAQADEQIHRGVRVPAVGAPLAAQAAARAPVADPRLAVLEAELTDARAKYTDSHPRIRALESEISTLRANPPPAPMSAASSPAAQARRQDPPAVGVRDTAASRRSVAQRRKALESVIHDAEQRAAQLTAVQGKAAQLLADVSVAQDRSTALLKLTATAEDDVRSASSDFQIVSRATIPERAEKGTGRALAVGAPLGALLIGLLVLLWREFGSLRVRTAAEASWWARAPVIWSSAWPSGTPEEARQLGREVANVMESRHAVIGITGIGDSHQAEELSVMVADRLLGRGEACFLVDLRNRAVPNRNADLADALEHRSLGELIAQARSMHRVVLLVLPSTDDMPALRAGLRWADAVVVIVESGKVTAPSLWGLRSALGLHEGGIGLVVTAVRNVLLHPAGRIAGLVQEFWPALDPNRPQLEQGADDRPRGRMLREATVITQALPPKS